MRPENEPDAWEQVLLRVGTAVAVVIGFALVFAGVALVLSFVRLLR